MNKILQIVKILKTFPDSYTDNGSILCEFNNGDKILVFCENLYKNMEILKKTKYQNAIFYVFSTPILAKTNKKEIKLNKNNGMISATGIIDSFWNKFPIIDIGIPVIINCQIKKNELIQNKFYQIKSGLKISFDTELFLPAE